MMGHKSKAAKKTIQNLPAPTISHKVTVEEVSDEEADSKYLAEKENQLECEGEVIDGILAWLEGLENEGFSEWDEEDMEDNDEEAEFETKDDAALLTFTQTLQRAYDAAAAAQREREASWKCKQHYTGNSSQTKERWSEKWPGIWVPGKKVFISNFFPKSTKAPFEDAYNSSDDLDEGTVEPEKTGDWDS